MMNKISPCKNCEFRTKNCHSNCYEYLEWKKRLVEYDRICRKKRYEERLMREHIISSVERNKR